MKSNGKVFIKVILNAVVFLKRGLVFKLNVTCKRAKLYNRVCSGPYQCQWTANQSSMYALVGCVRSFSSLTATWFVGAAMCSEKKGHGLI
jgi:hypothetical protein